MKKSKIGREETYDFVKTLKEMKEAKDNAGGENANSSKKSLKDRVIDFIKGKKNLHVEQRAGSNVDETADKETVDKIEEKNGIEVPKYDHIGNSIFNNREK